MNPEDSDLTDDGLAGPAAPEGRVLVVACGALAREILALKALNGWSHLDLQCLPANLHLRPERIPDADWKDIPTIKEAIGADISYNMLRGIFGPPGMSKAAVDWYIDFLKKVTDAPEFKAYISKGALKPAFATGEEYTKWVAENEKLHKELMEKGGLAAKK